MNKNQQAAIAEHGKNLLKVFPGAIETDPIKLCKRLRRIETKTGAAAVAYCNGEIDQDAWLTASEAALSAVQKLLKSGNIPIIINGDPRGYSLKIDDDYMRENDVRLHRDWGGYGILAPEIN